MADAMQMLYTAWRRAGLSDNQAKIMMAEMGRENGWDLQTIFVGHPEPVDVKRGVKTPRMNFGLISWNGTRRKQLINRLSSKGLFVNGQAVRSQATLDEMAKFAVWEMQHNRAYSATKKVFLSNPNIDYKTAVKVLGKNYIAWRYDDPAYASGHINRDRFYQRISGQLVKNSSPQMAGQQVDGMLARLAILNGKNAQITSPFGMRNAPTKGASTNHNGIDIAVPIGTPIYSPEDGVFGTNTHSKGGLQMWVNGASGYRFGFGHLSRINRRTGDRVRKGELIGFSGNSGTSTGPHIHFTVTNIHGVKIDPQNFILSSSSQTSSPLAPQRDPRLDMDAPTLLKNLRKTYKKMSDDELFANLVNGNGRAGAELQYLLRNGQSTINVAKQLGLNIILESHQNTEKNSFLDLSANEYLAEMKKQGKTNDNQLFEQMLNNGGRASAEINYLLGQGVDKVSIAKQLGLNISSENQPLQSTQNTQNNQTTLDYQPLSINNVKQLLPNLREQGLNDYQVLYKLASRDDDIGKNIRETYKRGLSLNEIATMFGLDFNGTTDYGNNSTQTSSNNPYPKLSQARIRGQTDNYDTIETQ